MDISFIICLFEAFLSNVFVKRVARIIMKKNLSMFLHKIPIIIVHFGELYWTSHHSDAPLKPVR